MLYEQQLWRLEVGDHGAVRVRFWWGPSSRLQTAICFVLTRQEAGSLLTFIRALIPFMSSALIKCAQPLSRVQLFVTPWTAACQAPLSMEFSRQEYWSGLPFPSPGDLLNPCIKPMSPALQADSLPSESPGKPSALIISFLILITSQRPHLLIPSPWR